MDPVSEQRLCQACGFCCDGTLFVRVMIQDGEPIESFRQAGLVVINSAEGQARMPQPCSAFSGNQCQTYDCRPLRCGTFRCRLLRSVADGFLTELDAHQQIEDTKRLRDQFNQVIEDVLPAFAGKALVDKMRDLRKVSLTLTGERLSQFRNHRIRLRHLKKALANSLDQFFYENDPVEDGKD
jgi:hypothetical protein